MRAHSNQLFTVALGAFAALSPAIVEAQGVFSFGRSLSELSNPDREAMRQARIAVLEKMQQGSVSAWTDKNTGHSGEVELRRIYERNGMTCGDVEYVLKMPEMRRFRIAFCRGGDGNWRLVG
jgi:surface antigen